MKNLIKSIFFTILFPSLFFATSCQNTMEVIKDNSPELLFLNETSEAIKKLKEVHIPAPLQPTSNIDTFSTTTEDVFVFIPGGENPPELNPNIVHSVRDVVILY